MSLIVLLAALLLALFGSAAVASAAPQAPEKPGQPDVVPMVGPVSMDQDLRDLPVIPQTNICPPRLSRHPLAQSATSVSGAAAADFVGPSRPTFAAPAMPGPLASYLGITATTSGCGCLPPDTDGDVSRSYYIQAVNSSFQIFDKSGVSQAGPTTYNSLFSALGTSTPCGNSQNDGDGIVFWDSIADRWVITDMAFPAFPGTSFYQCIAVSKTNNPVSDGWWLYALQIDSANPSYLGDYPKMVLWRDAYYLSVNLFSTNTTFNGVRVFALDRSKMINGTGAPTPSAVAFTVAPATLGDAYSLVPATFRYGWPDAGTPEYFLAVNSSATAGTTETQVFAWRFYVDWTTPANSTFGSNTTTHASDATITVSGFVDAFTAAAGSYLVPQTGTTRLLDTLGDKLMYPLVYQKRGGVESLYASQTVNNSGPTGIRWYQFIITGNVFPATPAQQQTFTNASDGLYRWMPSIAADSNGNVAIGYSVSSSTMNPAIRYAGRLTTDGASTLGQGEAVLIQGGGHQTNATPRWGDYSATFIDPSNGCTFWHTNEYYDTSGSANWYTRFGTFAFTTCSSLAITLASMSAATEGSAIRVAWDTVSEVGNAGFDLYRDTSPAGPGVKLNAALIPSQAPGSSSGFSYSYVDRANLAPGTTYTYWLEDVSQEGVTARHEPVSATYDAPTAVSLAAFGALPALPLALPLAGGGLAGLLGLVALARRRRG